MSDWLDAERRVERAQQLSESKRFSEALSELDAALSVNPDNAEWLAHRGFLLDELDRGEESVEAYERSIELGCEEPDVSIALALAQLRLSRFAQALGTLEALAHRVPDFEPAYCHRIQIYTELGQHDQAEQMFYLAQELNEDCPHCFFFVGSSLLARGQTDRAIYCFNKALELDPTYIGVNRRIGRAYRAKGQLDKAREFLIHELRDDPGNTDLLLELADLGLASGQPGAAIAKLQQVVELEPDHVDAQLALGKAYLGVGHAGEALKCFRAVEDYADDPEIKSELSVRIAEALARLDRHAEAISYIERRVTRYEEPECRAKRSVAPPAGHLPAGHR